MINKYSSIPLYKQLVDLLMKKIESNEYKPGDRIPSEQVLCDLYDISRPTVRQAVKELVANGILVKIKGKGTFVHQAQKKLDVDELTGFEYSVLDSDSIYDKNIITISKIDKADNYITKHFSVHGSEYCKILIEIRHDDILYGYASSYISLQHFPNIYFDLIDKKPSYEILKAKYPYLPVKSKNKIELAFSNREISQLMKIPQGKPILKHQSLLYSRSGALVEFIESIYLAQEVALHFEQKK